ncbi:MAG: sugar transferase [Deltaproteobacteria bacterium]|nr:sugar transferase [Deltaproteobacteria bacterium]
MDAERSKTFKAERIAQELSLSGPVKSDAAGWQIRVLRAVWVLLNKGLGHQLVLLIADILAILFGILAGWFLVVFILGIKENPSNYYHSIIICYLGVIGNFYALRGYKPTYLRRQEKELEIIIKSVTFSLLIIIALNFLVFKSAGFSRYMYGFIYLFVMIFLIIGRFSVKRLYRRFWKHDIGRERTVIIGRSIEVVNKLRALFRIQQFSRFKIIGYLERRNGEMLYSGNDGEQLISGDLNSFLEEKEITTVFVASEYSGETQRQYFNLPVECENKNRQIFTLSSWLMDISYTYNRDEYVGLIGISRSEPELYKRFPMMIKRMMDIVGSVFLIFVLSPVLISIGAVIKLQDRGAIFHRRLVVGRNGVFFNALKFRTMIQDADAFLNSRPELKAKFETNFKLRNDPRVTSFGRIIRKLSLDELPQLFNVLVGQMSLVGPRMVIPEELERYGEFKKERIKIRPGISGYWQVSGRQEVDYEERIQMDRFYMYRWTIWMDIWLALKTIQKVLKMEGAV